MVVLVKTGGLLSLLSQLLHTRWFHSALMAERSTKMILKLVAESPPNSAEYFLRRLSSNS